MIGLSSRFITLVSLSLTIMLVPGCTDEEATTSTPEISVDASLDELPGGDTLDLGTDQESSDGNTSDTLPTDSADHETTTSDIATGDMDATLNEVLDGETPDESTSDLMTFDQDSTLADGEDLVEEIIPEDESVVSDPFSFFVTSLSAMRELSGSVDGFGGDLGGLEGADNICQTIAESVGAGDKTWRAFLSTTGLFDGTPVNAIDRIGEGPWYDRNERLVSENIAGLLGDRPDGSPQSVNDLPDEFGQPLSFLGDSHDILTGSNDQGELFDSNPITTCNDWTETDLPAADNRVMIGHSWPREDGGPGPGPPGGGTQSWMSEHPAPGCLPGVELADLGPGFDGTVGGGGGFGGIYCFALAP